MPLFPSWDWMAEFCDQLEAAADADAVAGDLAGTYRFVVEPAGPLRDRHVYDVELLPGGGADGATVTLLEEPAARPRLVMSADYHRWRQLISGQLDLGLAVMLRRVRINGDIGSLLRHGSSAAPLLDALAGVESEWLD